jgi:ribosomal protein S27E
MASKKSKNRSKRTTKLTIKDPRQAALQVEVRCNDCGQFETLLAGPIMQIEDFICSRCGNMMSIVSSSSGHSKLRVGRKEKIARWHIRDKGLLK